MLFTSKLCSFVRREKQIAESRYEIAQEETLRYRLRAESLERELNEVQDSMKASRARMEVCVTVLILSRVIFTASPFIIGKTSGKCSVYFRFKYRMFYLFIFNLSTNPLIMWLRWLQRLWLNTMSWWKRPKQWTSWWKATNCWERRRKR